MQRSAIHWLVLGLALTVSGCGLFKKKSAPTTSADYGANQQVATNPYPTDAGYSQPVPTSNYGSAAGSRAHTVTKKETLYSLARQYYGDHTKWRVIYEANRTDIGEDPNRLRVGQKLAIP